VLTDGVTVFGGSSRLRDFDKLLEEALGFPIRMAERPLTCVAEGAARCLDDPSVLRAYEDAFVEIT
jgi:rod shape-determining protein MreB